MGQTTADRVSFGEHRGVVINMSLFVHDDGSPSVTTYHTEIAGTEYTVFSSDGDHQQQRKALVKLIDILLDEDRDKFDKLVFSTILHTGGQVSLQLSRKQLLKA